MSSVDVIPRRLPPAAAPNRKPSYSLARSRPKEVLSIPPLQPQLPLLPSYNNLQCKPKLHKVQAMPLNVSPFDTSRYVPMLPEVAAKHQGRVSLALDIDETLVHSMAVSASQLFDVAPTAARRAAWVSEMRSQCDLHLHLHAGTAKEELIFVRFRPGVREFLQFASERFEVIIFTASQRSYADPLMDALDPTGLLRRDLRLYREHCADVGGVKVKDLSLLGRPLPRVALVDNLASSFMFQPRNGIHIRSWYGDKADTELFTLMDVLRELAQASAVQNVLDAFNALA